MCESKIYINGTSHHLKNEAGPHKRVVKFIWEKYPNALLIPGLGENQIALSIRVNSFYRGHIKGKCEPEPNRYYNGQAIKQGVLNFLKRFEARSFEYLVSNDYDEVVI